MIHHRCHAANWIGSGLATCGYLAAGGLALGQSEEKTAPKGYTLPGPGAE
jgi:hypothetical protein